MGINLKDKTVLVTGGAGFIGSHLVDRLIEEGANVVVVDNLSSGRKENVNVQAIFYEADIRNREELRQTFQKEKPNAVFHLAAQPLVEAAYEHPLETFEVNVMGTANVLETCRQQGGFEAIVVVSSDKAYGKAKTLPYSELMSVGGDHPYEVSKASGDLIAQSYCKTYGTPLVIARFGNTFGPRDLNFGRIIPDCFEAILKNKELLIRSDGKMIRDYVYVKDIAEACIKLASDIEKIQGEAFNFGAERPMNVLEVVGEIEKILGVKIPYKILNTAKNEIPKQHLDWSKAKSLLAWQPQYTFTDAIRESFEWYKRNIS